MSQMKTISASEFKRLGAKRRGWIVYMFGARKDQPNIPDEANPFPVGTVQHTRWNEGANEAAQLAADCP